MKKILLHSFIAVVLLLGACQPESTTTTESSTEILAQNLSIPWEIVFLPEGGMLVTERGGNLLKVDTTQKLIKKIEGVTHQGEGGLLGMALHPNFENNRYLYLYLTTQKGGALHNRVERYTFENDTLTDPRTIIDNIPGAIYHDGGKLAFGPDRYLYITTGDATREELAQDTQSLAGKILRLKDDGSIPEDNPFQNEVYSYGHRNSQGLTWDDQGRLWATEHGRSGLTSGLDEINLIEKGANYGWPRIQGDETAAGMKTPIAHSGPKTTWAPASIVFHEGRLYFAGLRGESVYKVDVSGDLALEVSAHLHKEFGRLRALTLSPDGNLILSTSNTDGRGTPRQNDDKIIRISLDITPLPSQ